MVKSVKSPSDSSVDQTEIDKFTALAGEWWNPHGKFRPLHLFNPVRLFFIRDLAASHFGRAVHAGRATHAGRAAHAGRDPRALRPFEGLRLLDIGCGGGLLSEPMARLGFDVTGADASERNVLAAAAHAQGSGLSLRYRNITAERLAEEGARFDVVLNMEVVEHVADLPGFLRACANVIAPGGFMIVATLNRTLKSLALAKIGAEYVLRWLPPGTHDWNRFVTPEELRKHLNLAGLNVTRLQGVSFDPLRWEWRLSNDTAVNYMAVGEPAKT